MTISEICEAAGANIAAVNYHFNSKENLFRQVLRQAHMLADKRYPIDGGLPQSAEQIDANIRLRGDSRRPLRPFDNAKTLVELRPAQVTQLVLARYPVQINVVNHAAWQVVRLDERVRGTWHRAFVPHGTDQGPREG